MNFRSESGKAQINAIRVTSSRLKGSTCNLRFLFGISRCAFYAAHDASSLLPGRFLRSATTRRHDRVFEGALISSQNTETRISCGIFRCSCVPNRFHRPACTQIRAIEFIFSCLQKRELPFMMAPMCLVHSDLYIFQPDQTSNNKLFDRVNLQS